MHVQRHESETSKWETVRREPPAFLRPYLLAGVEGWAQVRGTEPDLRELPFPGVPLILDVGAEWDVEDPEARGPERLRSFVAGLSTAATIVRGQAEWSCIELRLTPLGAFRLLGVPMSELTNRSIELEVVVPGARILVERLRETSAWSARFDLVESFLAQRLAEARPAHEGVEWSWRHLYATHGRTSIAGIAEELGWSQRRLVARFREQIGLSPKLLARVIRFDRAVAALRAPGTRGLAEVAFDCGYFDQAHLNREFRDLAGTSPGAFRRARGGAG